MGLYVSPIKNLKDLLCFDFSYAVDVHELFFGHLGDFRECLSCVCQGLSNCGIKAWEVRQQVRQGVIAVSHAVRGISISLHALRHPIALIPIPIDTCAVDRDWIGEFLLKEALSKF